MVQKVQLVSYSAAATTSLGEKLGKLLKSGDVVLLTGEMGAGKSVVARGIARGLGVDGYMTSPTFTIMQVYEGRLPVYHFDLYRLSSAEELYSIGLDEFIGNHGVALIEWHQNVQLEPQSYIEILLEHSLEDERQITITTVNRTIAGLEELST